MRRALLVCGFAVVLVLVFVLVLGPGSRTSRAPSTTPVVAARPTAREPAPRPVAPATNVAATAGDLDREYGETRAPLADPLTTYKRINQYPPTSRPLSIHHDLVTPNRRYESPLRARGDSDVTYWFSADKGTLVGDDVLHAFLEVRRDGEPIDVTIVSASADRVPLAFARRGARYETDLHVADLRYAAAATVDVRVTFEYAPGQTQVASFPVLYTPRAAIPARFTGRFREQIVDGSLVVYAGIEVREPGWYLIDANLWGADDSPVAWTRYKGNLAPNDNEVALSFFGKVLVDAGAPSPYQVRQLRGARYVERRDPDTDSMPFFAGVYTTRAYALDRFSAAEWDSEHKQQMIRLLAEQQRTGRHNPAAGGDPAGDGDD